MLNVTLRNLGTINKNSVIMRNERGRLELVFSYETIVSFNVSANGFYDNATIQNYWSNTTGKLLNECCPDKTKRLNQEQFNERLKKAFDMFSNELTIVTAKEL